MKALATLVTVICCAAPLGDAAEAGSVGLDRSSDRNLAFTPGGRGGGDGGSLPGAPGGRGGAAGVPDPTVAAGHIAGLKRYCSGILESRRPAQGGDYRPSDCAALFSGLGDPAAEHPSSGWDGVPRRGSAGSADEALNQYCMTILMDPQRPPTSPEGYRPADCIDLFSALESRPADRSTRRHARDGVDGPSIAGGVGGRGGRGGAGPGGGAGGAGGAGSAGGAGGRGGAGGASD